MKKETVIFGSILAVFLLLMSPNISAINAHSAETEIKERIQHLEKNFDGKNGNIFFHSKISTFQLRVTRKKVNHLESDSNVLEFLICF